MKLFDKEKEAVRFIRKAYGLALSLSNKGFYVAFSGGKDSQVLYHLMQESGCKFEAHMQVTTVDPPQLMKFVRSRYTDVRLHLPDSNMRKLILQKGQLPLKQVRYCCQELKEQAGRGRCVCVGIRAYESVNRAKRKPVEIYHNKKPLFKPSLDIIGDKIVETRVQFDLFDVKTESVVTCVKGSDKIILSPIFKWTDADVWNYIRNNKIEYCKLYDMGFHRIGCMFCPMASKREKQLELSLFGRAADKIYIRAIRELMQQGKYSEFDSPESVFLWWISNENRNKWLNKNLQSKIHF